MGPEILSDEILPHVLGHSLLLGEVSQIVSSTVWQAAKRTFQLIQGLYLSRY